MPSREAFRELAALVAASSAVATRRARSLNVDDVRQDAWVAALLALQAWRPERGPLAPYAATAIRRAVAATTLRTLSPVSASYKRRKELFGLSRAPLAAASWRSDVTPEVEAMAAEAATTRLLRELAPCRR